MDGGSPSAYAQLNEGGSITKLGADDLASMNVVRNILPMSMGGTYTTWTQETFQIFTGGANETDPETMKKVLPGDRLETNDMFQQIFMFYGRNTRLNRKSLGDAAIQFGLDVEGIGNPSFGKKGSKLNSMSVKVTSLDSVKYTGFTREKDTTIFYDNSSGAFDKAYKPVLDSSYNRSIRNFNNHVPNQYRIKR